MNRKKKINQIFKKKAKLANAKRGPKSSERYVSKAERAALAAQSESETSTSDDDKA